MLRVPHYFVLWHLIEDLIFKVIPFISLIVLQCDTIIAFTHLGVSKIPKAGKQVLGKSVFLYQNDCFVSNKTNFFRGYLKAYVTNTPTKVIIQKKKQMNS